MQFFKQSVKQSGAAAFAGLLFENKTAAKELAVVVTKARRPSIVAVVEGQSLMIGVEDFPPENADDGTIRSEPNTLKKRRSITMVQ